MPTQYIIEGELVTRRDYSDAVSVPLDTLLENLTKLHPLNMDHLPTGLRAINVQQVEDGRISAKMLIEQTPRKRNISYKNTAASRSGDVRQYRIQLPFVWFWVSLMGSKVTNAQGERTVWSPNGWGQLWSNEPYQDWNSPAWLPAFPNLFGDSRICFGGVRQDVNQSLGHYVDASINGYWTSEFNRDIDWYGPVGGGTLRDWETDDDFPNWEIWTNRSPERLSGWLAAYNTGFDWEEPVPASTANPIPELPLIPTFSNFEGWLSSLNSTDRERVIHTVREWDG